MTPAVASLLRRLVSLVATASAATETHAVAVLESMPTRDSDGQTSLARTEQTRTNKLVFGVARRGATQLASHRSHASHASHYSGAGGSDSKPPAPVTPLVPAPAQTVAPKPTTPPRVEVKQPATVAAVPAEALTGEVLKKLIRIRSRWPKDALLTKDVQFNLFDGDRMIGVIGLKAGAKVRLVEIKSAHAIIQFGASQSPMPVTNTDIITQLGGSEKILALPDDPDPNGGKTEPRKDAPKPAGKA